MVLISPINAEDNSTLLAANITGDTIIITEDNIQDYFDDTNTLNSSFENKTLEFQGEFDYCFLSESFIGAEEVR